MKTTAIRTLEATMTLYTAYTAPAIWEKTRSVLKDAGYLATGLVYLAEEGVYIAIDNAPVIWKKTQPIREEALFLAENMVGWVMMAGFLGVKALGKGMKALRNQMKALGKSLRTFGHELKEWAISAWTFREELIAEWA